MTENRKMSRRQLTALGFVCVLSSLTRRVPRPAAVLSGAGAFSAALVSVLPLAALLAVVLLLEWRLCRGDSLGRAIISSLGGFFGRAVILVYGVWFVLLAGFTLRSGADRLANAVYPDAPYSVFCVVGLAACLPAVCGKIKVLARSAMIFRLLLLGILLPVLLAALPGVRPAGALIPSAEEIKSVPLAALSFVHPLAVSAFLAFLSGDAEGRPDRRGAAGWALCSWGIAVFICLVCLGTLGPELCSKIRDPFFAVVREISIFGSVEHFEALIVSSWVLCDFILISVLLYMAGELFSLTLGVAPAARLPLSLVLCAASCAVSIFCAKTGAGFAEFYDGLVPVINLALSCVLLPAVMLLALCLRRR